MRKTLLHAALVLSLFAFAAHAAAPAVAVEDPKACQICRMDRTMFAHSRMLVEYSDGTVTGTCSIHCVAADLKKQGVKAVRSFKVADYDTKALIDAKTATWVIGGSRKGVMTGVPKWAFSNEAGAQAFIKEFGGKIVPFHDIRKAAEAEVSDGGSRMGH
jgi:nitrous oxide reductase accessory protein NosL